MIVMKIKCIIAIFSAIALVLNSNVTIINESVAPWNLTVPWQENLTQNEMDMLAQLVMAEAGNQDLTGKRYVVDVVINRVNDARFPDTIKEVIYQKKQFSCIDDGNFDRCYEKATKDCYDAIKLEYTSMKLDDEILYFSSTEYAVNGKNPFKHGDHWFSY